METVSKLEWWEVAEMGEDHKIISCLRNERTKEYTVIFEPCEDNCLWKQSAVEETER